MAKKQRRWGLLNAAREILRRVDQYGVPLEEALRGVKHDWYRILELPNRQLQNTMLLSPTVGEAFWKREIWTVPGLTEGSEAAQVHTGCQAQDQQDAVFGFAPDDDTCGEGMSDGVPLFNCSLHTDGSNCLQVPSPVLLRIHSCFAKAAEVNDVEREVAKPWPPAEPAALRLLESRAPSVHSPLVVDIISLAASGKPWLIMMSMPGRRLGEMIHRMSYPERHRLADAVASAIDSYRNIPNNPEFLVASASGGYLQSHRASSNILVDAGRLSAIIDWQFAGFYPACWEYTKAMLSARHTEHCQAIFSTHLREQICR
ncbi:hypothetical protein MY11210_004154 [Beauveria gryllotalpidicola]